MTTTTKKQPAPPSMPKAPKAEGTEAAPAKTKRPRRTPEQTIADLEAKLAATRRRAALASVKDDPVMGPVLRSIGSIQKALEAATEANNEGAIGVLTAAHDAIRDYVTAQGIEL